jgi:metallo-beta-lactamase family protein
MPLLLKFHGALDEVTGSCHFFKVKASGNIYAVDCGVVQGRQDEDDQPASPINLPADCQVKMLSGILITHAHGDHISLLPEWFEAGFNGSIFCSKETARLLEVALKDGQNIDRRNGKRSVDGGAFRRTLYAVRNATHVALGEKITLEHNVTLEAAPTSHLLGSCAFRIVAVEGAERASVNYTGDIGPVEFSDETRSLYAQRERHSEPSDYIVSESTYGSRRRSKESSNGLRRLEGMEKVLRKGLRHGGNSLVVIPAFSLQRSLDVLCDVVAVLHYRRHAIDMDPHIVPKIIIHSRLSYEFAQIYRDLYHSTERSPFFNEKSTLANLIREAGELDHGLIDDIVPYGRERTLHRIGDHGEAILTDIVWGSEEPQKGQPTVVICASGMTLNGPIVGLMRKHLEDATATFVLCGYVPGYSPGGRLRDIADLPVEQRSGKSIQLPGDPKRQQLPTEIAGDAVKCGFDSVSEYYSGHADSESIIRYILGARCELAQHTKGIFLVHGERRSREQLEQMIGEACQSHGQPTPPVHKPIRGGSWFDCQTGRFAARSDMANADHAHPVGGDLTLSEDLVRAIDAVPEDFIQELRLQTSLTVRCEQTPEEVLDLIEEAFADARPNRRDDGVLLKVGPPYETHSTVLIGARQLVEGVVKIDVSTIFRRMAGIASIGSVAFDWRQLLNALQLPKEQHYAGARWCVSEDEVERLLNACAPHIYDGKQRRQPVVLVPEGLLDRAEIGALERMITPMAHLAIVDMSWANRINQTLGLAGEWRLTGKNVLYLPIMARLGVKSTARVFGGVDIARLAELISDDTSILNTREPQLARQPAELLNPATELPQVRLPVSAALRNKDRMQLPVELFMKTATGLSIGATILKVNQHARSGRFIFAIAELEGMGVNGLLHVNCAKPDYSPAIGEKVTVWIRSVDAESRAISLSQREVNLPGGKLHELLRAKGTVTIADIIGLREGLDFESARRAALESFLMSGKPDEPVTESTSLDEARAIDTFNRLVRSLGLIDKIEIPPPAPAKGVTYGDVAAKLGYTLQQLMDAATFMAGVPESLALGVGVLPTGFVPNADSPFPADLEQKFISECRGHAERGWGSATPDPAKLQPDCFSIAHLAGLMGIPQPTLLARLEAKGITPEVRVVVTQDDIKRLIG